MRKDISTDQVSRRINDIYQATVLHHGQLMGFGFSRGILGLAVLNYLYGEWTGDPNYRSDAQEWFNEACSQIESQTTSNFILDLSELGILTEFLSKRGVLCLDVNEFLSDVDSLLREQLAQSIKQGNIGGFVNGALSTGLYFLHRLDSDRKRFTPILQELTTAIEKCSIRHSEGVYWRSFFRPDENTVYLTFPHGSAAIILFLTVLAEGGVVSQSAIRPLVSQGIAFIMAQEISDKFYCFSDLLNSTDESRLALCYGDVGVGYVLLRSGQVFGESAWTDAGLRVLTKASERRDQQHTKVRDAGILFGATGLAIAFNRIYNLTNLVIFQDTAQYWFNAISKFATQDDEFAGFKSAHNQWHSHTNVSFTEGIIGIGAGLIKSVNPGRVDIDELLWLL